MLLSSHFAVCAAIAIVYWRLCVRSVGSVGLGLGFTLFLSLCVYAVCIYFFDISIDKWLTQKEVHRQPNYISKNETRKRWSAQCTKLNNIFICFFFNFFSHNLLLLFQLRLHLPSFFHKWIDTCFINRKDFKLQSFRVTNSRKKNSWDPRNCTFIQGSRSWLKLMLLAFFPFSFKSKDITRSIRFDIVLKMKTHWSVSLCVMETCNGTPENWQIQNIPYFHFNKLLNETFFSLLKDDTLYKNSHLILQM